MKYLMSPIILTLFWLNILNAQNIGVGTNSPKPSALLDITSTDKGVLLPRVSTLQRKAILNPERGLLVFDTDKSTFMFFDGARWKALSFNDEEKATLWNRTAPSPKSYSQFGQAADIYGNYAIIGAPFFSSQQPGFGKMGEAYIFFKDSSGWKMQARLAAPDSSSFDFFGSAVAIYDDYCAVGVSQKYVGGNYNQGKVYVYKRTGTAWNLEAGLTEPVGSSGDQFGYSVDITLTSANLPVLAVGAPNTANNNKGQVLTYSRNAVTNTWNYLQTLAPPDLSANNNFGLSVTMHKDYLAIGAPAQDNTQYNLVSAGAVYIYVFGGGVFTQQQKVAGYYANAEFGYTLSLFEDKLAIGAPWACADGGTTGSAYVALYKRTGATWDYTNNNFTISASQGGSFNMRYGLRLSINDNQLLIGAPSGIIFPGGSSIGGALAGAVYIFVTGDGGGTYYLKERLLSPTSYTGDLFSHAVSIESTGNYIIGIPYQNVSSVTGIAPTAGGVYFGY